MSGRDLERIDNYITAIIALAKTADNENTAAIIQMCLEIEKITYAE